MDSLVLLKDHGPVGMLVVGMLLTGSLINNGNFPKDLSPPSQHWCNATAKLQPALMSMPFGLEETVVVLSVVLPTLPLAFCKMSPTNLEMLKAHFAGQTSSYGLSQVMRHFTVYPEPNFLEKCNITRQECVSRALLQEQQSLISKDNETDSFCNRTFNPATLQELFDSSHNIPNSTSAILGSSLVTLLAILFYWHRLNGKSLSESDSCLQLFMVCLQSVLLIVLAMYCYYLYVSFESVQIFGLIFGAAIQFCIVVAMLREQ